MEELIDESINSVRNYATLKLYKNTKFYAHQNYKIDSIEDFLNTLDTPKNFNIQYFKTLEREKEIKIKWSQSNIKDLHQYNYARIQVISNDNVDWTLYYFVTKIQWISSNAVKLSLRIDSLNTFLDRLTFSPRTMVEREHIDRWDYEAYNFNGSTRKIMRKIPYTNEGLNPLKYCYIYNSSGLISENDITENKGTTGMSIYNTGTDVVNSKDVRHYISYYYYNSTDGKFSVFYFTASSFTSYIYIDYGGDIQRLADLSAIQLNTESSQIKLTLLPYIPDKGMYKIDKYNSSSNPLTPATLTSLGSGLIPNIITIGSYDYHTIGYIPSKIYNYEFYDYAPVINDTIAIPQDDVLDESAVTDVTFKSVIEPLLVATFNTNFSTIQNNHCFHCNGVGWLEGQYETNESSMFSSEFFDLEFFLDKSNYHLALEDFSYCGGLTRFQNDWASEKYPFIKIQFYPSLYMDNSYIFKFRANSNYFHYVGENPNDYHTMVVSSNNQVPMFDDAYKNYMRNVYNYDIKGNSLNLARIRTNLGINLLMNGLNAPLAMAGGMMAGNYAGMAIAGGMMANKGLKIGLHGISDLIFTKLSQDLEMEKKQAELKAQRVGMDGVNGALEHIFRVNPTGKLGMFFKAPNSDYWKSISDYFYYFGNKIRKYKVPTHNNRALFDYLKCEADFVNRNSVPSSECLSDIEERLNNGVTFIHKYLNQWTLDTDYKENVENALLSIL